MIAAVLSTYPQENKIQIHPTAEASANLIATVVEQGGWAHLLLHAEPICRSWGSSTTGGCGAIARGCDNAQSSTELIWVRRRVFWIRVSLQLSALTTNTLSCVRPRTQLTNTTCQWNNVRAQQHAPTTQNHPPRLQHVACIVSSLPVQLAPPLQATAQRLARESLVWLQVSYHTLCLYFDYVSQRLDIAQPAVWANPF